MLDDYEAKEDRFRGKLWLINPTNPNPRVVTKSYTPTLTPPPHLHLQLNPEALTPQTHPPKTEHTAMVKLTEVADEHFIPTQPYHDDDDDDDAYSDTSSSVSSTHHDDDDLNESFYDRITALKDMIPPRQRAAFNGAVSKTYALLSGGLSMGGTALWVLVTSTFVLGVPFAVAVGDEQQLLEMEKEMKV